MTDSIKIGTRGSKLALWQAYYIQDLLKAKNIASKIITIETKGDKILDVSIAKIGSKGVFTEEIEEQLLTGTIDIAVHSAKDMQSELPKNFELIAFTEREKVNDVLVSEKETIDLNDSNLVIGTSSTRRIAMLKHYFPKVRTVPVRGNLQTRIKKMQAGECDALLLAYAGMYRMGYSELIKHQFPIETFTPAVGQGSIAIECCTSLDSHKKNIIREAINDSDTEKRLLCERAFLRTLEGGCSIPVFGLARLKDQEISFTGGIVSLDGNEMVRKKLIGPHSDSEKIGTQLAYDVLQAGGAKILTTIIEELKE